MLKRRPCVGLWIALAYASATLYEAPSQGQLSPVASAETDAGDAAAAATDPETTVGTEAQRPDDRTVAAEASATATSPAEPSKTPAEPTQEPTTPTQPPTEPAQAPTEPAQEPGEETEEPEKETESKWKERYRDGMIIWETSNEAKVPFLLKFNINTQVRYLDTTASEETFTDHLGVIREVNTRRDITVNRAMFILGGYVFDPRLRYSFTVWTSAGAASIVVAGNIGWSFNRGFTLTGGYTGVPGSRSLVNTFPFFSSSDRSMADNFFRPAFTQGIWANGEPIDGLHYLAFIGNGLNTLNITASKIDTNLLYSASVWWEPLGNYGPAGKARNMYDDYFAEKKVRLRLGGAFTSSREDRFSNLDQSSPENTSMHNSDGVLTFSTGAFAPGVTVDEALYEMGAVDVGLKWNGLAINGQYFFRWISDFVADGPIPIEETYDNGFELSALYFVLPEKLAVYGRGSAVYGEFGDSWEYAGGVKWHPAHTERMWINAELMRVEKAPYTGTFTPYVSGLTGWVPMLQAVLAF